MNILEEYIKNNKGKFIEKHSNYPEIYNLHLSQFRGKPVNILEIGVYQGGSLQMWKHYFGEKCNIFGLDINPSCKEFEEDQIKIFIGDQENRKFLRELKKKLPKIDVLIDDGGHTMNQQITTFEELFPHVKENGVYICEDLCTSYWTRFGGGYLKPRTFIEYSKNFIDYINAWHSVEKDKLSVSDFTKSVYSLHFYDSILVIQKKPMEKAHNIETGQLSRKPPILESPIPFMLNNFPWLYYKIRKLYYKIRCLKYKYMQDDKKS